LQKSSVTLRKIIVNAVEQHLRMIIKDKDEGPARPPSEPTTAGDVIHHNQARLGILQNDL
jgi:hypothetical protein